jgi:spore coat polysaccharide biosynthesis protein SpsF
MRIAFLITARLKSERLKKKILLDLNGKSVVERVIERARAVKDIDGVVVCTSTEKEDHLLVDIAGRNNVDHFCGSSVDVMDRLMNAALTKGYDAFLSITADNPLFSITTSDLIVDWMRTSPCDFIYTKGLPTGCGTYGIDIKAMQVANLMKKEADTEIWGPFINRPDFFNIGELLVVNCPYREEYRITCDFPEDYELIREIYGHFEMDHIPGMEEVIRLLNENPAILQMNSMHKQRHLSADFMESIHRVFEEARAKGIAYARSIEKELQPGYTKREYYI